MRATRSSYHQLTLVAYRDRITADAIQYPIILAMMICYATPHGSGNFGHGMFSGDADSALKPAPACCFINLLMTEVLP